MSDLIRVLVFGSTGVGKTSLCNALTNQNQPVNDGVKGVTFAHHNYPPVKLDSKNLLITDTVGLNESDKGTVKPSDAINLLIKLIKDSDAGYNLLIHVISKGRITNALYNYKLFVEGIANSKIPTILVVTGCEDIDPMSKWGNENFSDIAGMGLNYKDIVCTSFAKSERPAFAKVYESLHLESTQAISRSILQYATTFPVVIYTNENGFWTVIKQSWNSFCAFFDMPDWIVNVDKNITAIMRRMGLSDDQIKDIMKPMNYLGKKR